MERTALSVIYLLIVKPVTSQMVYATDVIVISQDPIAYKVCFAILDYYVRLLSIAAVS